MELLTDRINNKLDKRNLINEHTLNREPVPLKTTEEGSQLSVTCSQYNLDNLKNLIPDTNQKKVLRIPKLLSPSVSHLVLI